MEQSPKATGHPQQRKEWNQAQLDLVGRIEYSEHIWAKGIEAPRQQVLKKTLQSKEKFSTWSMYENSKQKPIQNETGIQKRKRALSSQNQIIQRAHKYSPRKLDLLVNNYRYNVFLFHLKIVHTFDVVQIKKIPRGVCAMWTRRHIRESSTPQKNNEGPTNILWRRLNLSINVHIHHVSWSIAPPIKQEELCLNGFAKQPWIGSNLHLTNTSKVTQHITTQSIIQTGKIQIKPIWNLFLLVHILPIYTLSRCRLNLHRDGRKVQKSSYSASTITLSMCRPGKSFYFANTIVLSRCKFNL